MSSDTQLLAPRHNSDRVEARPRDRIVALDGLRGVAIAGVLLFHAGHLQGGFLGVDLFFVLSGYLITSLLLREVRVTRTIALRSFWSRRARRLLPPVVALAFLVVIGGRLFAAPGQLAGVRGDLLSMFTYTANWRFIAIGTNYWSRLSVGPLQHVWSLAIEEQFYVVWPIVVLVLVRRRVRPATIAVVATVGAVASSAAMFLVYTPGDVTRAYFGTDSHATPVLVGCALAGFVTWHGPVRTRAGRVSLDVAALGSLAFLAYAWASFDGERPFLYHGGFLVCAVASASVIAAAASGPDGLLARALGWQPLVALGLVSYGVYVYHWPIFLWLTPGRAHVTNGLALDALRVLLSIAVATLSYLVLERPVRRGRPSLRATAALVPVCAVVLVPLVVTLPTGDSPAAALGVVRGHDTPPPAAPSDVRVMVAGDSIALSLGTGLATLPRTDHLAVWNRGRVGCGLLSEPSRITPQIVTTLGPECRSYLQQWASDVAAFRPRVVVLVASAWDLFDRVVDGRTVSFDTRAWDDLYRSALQRAASTLTARGAHVLLLSVPCIDAASPSLSPFYRAAFTDARVRHLNALARQVATRLPRTTTFVDLNRLVCPGGTYAPSVHGVHDVRGDGVHFSPAGRALVGRWLLPSVDRAR